MNKTLLSAFFLVILLSLPLLKAGLLFGVDEKTLAPDFTLKDLNDMDVSRSSFKGKVVLINFWGTFCIPCRKEMPSIETLYKIYKDKGFLVIAVSEDKDLKDVKDFVNKYGLTFTIVMDQDKRVAKQYKISALPVTFLVDKKGMISKKFFGDRDWADKESRKMIEDLLSE